MSRSIWKGPFVDGYLLKKAEEESGKSDINDQTKYLVDQKIEVLKTLN